MENTREILEIAKAIHRNSDCGELDFLKCVVLAIKLYNEGCRIQNTYTKKIDRKDATDAACEALLRRIQKNLASVGALAEYSNSMRKLVENVAPVGRANVVKNVFALELIVGDNIKRTVVGSDPAKLKKLAAGVILKALKASGKPCGYYDLEMTITKDGEYFDSEPEMLIYVDKNFETVKLAHGVGLGIAGKTNMPNLAIDYIELELADGAVTTLDWDTSYWDGDNEEGSFFIDLPSVSTGDDKMFLDSEILKTAKIKNIQVHSPVKVTNPWVSIEKIDIREDDVITGTNEYPDIEAIVYEF